jgi:hypothetical protein
MIGGLTLRIVYRIHGGRYAFGEMCRSSGPELHFLKRNGSNCCRTRGLSRRLPKVLRRGQTGWGPGAGLSCRAKGAALRGMPQGGGRARSVAAGAGNDATQTRQARNHDPHPQGAPANSRGDAGIRLADRASRCSTTLPGTDQRHSRLVPGGISRPLRRRSDRRPARSQLPAEESGDAVPGLPGRGERRGWRRCFGARRRVATSSACACRRGDRARTRAVGRSAGSRPSRPLISADIAAARTGSAPPVLRPRLPRPVRRCAARRRTRDRLPERQRRFAFAALQERFDGRHATLSAALKDGSGSGRPFLAPVAQRNLRAGTPRTAPFGA